MRDCYIKKPIQLKPQTERLKATIIYYLLFYLFPTLFLSGFSWAHEWSCMQLEG